MSEAELSIFRAMLRASVKQGGMLVCLTGDDEGLMYLLLVNGDNVTDARARLPRGGQLWPARRS